ncbi:MAG: BlaI/MecI/CopY family transcriptional regulator [Planctomycetota bacterium]
MAKEEFMVSPQTPTQRELDILKILWDRGECTVREVYECIREEAPIVQNTVQAMLRTMEEKGLVAHHTVGRAFVYRAAAKKERTVKQMVGKLLDSAFDGSVDQLVQSLFSLRSPSPQELDQLQTLIKSQKAKQRPKK